MGQFVFIQFGYLLLFAFVAFIGGRVVLAYLKAEKPPENSLLLVAMLLGLSVTAGVSGYVCIDKALSHNQAVANTTQTIQQELAEVRAKYDAAVKPLQKAREQALYASSYGGNLAHQQNLQYQRAQQLTEMIELEQARYQDELRRISQVFAAANETELVFVQQQQAELNL